ncbi:MAG: hypothetical protein IT249_19840 [Chitinophagaceae bacterium]|nr:hypothetical protein [Chitinophagaceae bacterium]
MQNSFSFSRLWLLIKKQWFDNAKLYSLSALALTGILIIIFTIWWLANKQDHYFNEASTYGIFLAVLFVAGFIFSSTSFGVLGDKAKGIYWLSVPATPLEKLICGFFYSFIVFTVVYFTSFWLVKHITFFLIELNPQNTLRKADDNDVFKRIVLPNFLYAFFALQALFMLGSVYFERFAFIKTVLVSVFIAFIFVMFLQFIVNNLLPEHFGTRSFTEFRVYENDDAVKIYKLPNWIGAVIEPLAKFIWVPVLLIATYFRLKEKEI